MNAPNARRGGLEVWAPSVVPPIGVDLSNEQALAVAFRHLAAIGFAENMAGHITWQPDGQTDMFVNPWGLWWQELTASDICVVDGDARVVRGRWDVTPAIHIHTELHRVRDDARVVIHNHPYYVCVLAALGRLPELVHQTGSLFLDDLCLVDTYDGEIDSPARAADLAARIGGANLTILANHGVIATGRNLPEAVYRAASIERVCKLAYDVMLTGKEPVQMNWSDMVGMQTSLIERAADVYWAGAARMTIKADPDVLTLERNIRSAFPQGDRRREIDRRAGRQPELHHRQDRRGSLRHLPARTRPGRRRRYTVISVDDHIVEPPDTFTGRLPRKFADRAPKVVDTEQRRTDVGLRRSGTAQRRLQRRGRAAGVRVRVRAGPIR